MKTKLFLKISLSVVFLIWAILFLVINHKYKSPNIIESDYQVYHNGISYELLDVEVKKNVDEEALNDGLGENIEYVITVKVNNTSEAQKIDLSEVVLYRTDYSNCVALDYYYDENEDVSLYLEAGEEKIYKFPFIIYQNLFTDKQWKNIENSDWKLLLNLYPEKIMLDIS